ncbi:MAG TPA: YicC/YloC family endoribonuclease [Gemmatimonadaceae bacterium]|nr:YicC/YloC family endoribonuclease [Gemmatimonadaceae bacterium]
MTGFGAAAGDVGGLRVTVEIRTVNHRFHSPNLKLPSALARFEPEVREHLRNRIARGHVTVVARLERSSMDEAVVDEVRFAAYADRLRDLQRRYDLDDDLDVGTVVRMPGVLSTDALEEVGESPAPFLAIVERAADALVQMRQREGERMVAILRERLGEVSGRIDRIAARAPARLVEERERLRRAVRELADGIDVEEPRLAQEIAILADKMDVAEELDRFRAHVEAFAETLEQEGGEPVGRRLAFLTQEMLRETNTTGSKARDTVMLHEVVAVKEELERIAEQIENLE